MADPGGIDWRLRAADEVLALFADHTLVPNEILAALGTHDQAGADHLADAVRLAEENDALRDEIERLHSVTGDLARHARKRTQQATHQRARKNRWRRRAEAAERELRIAARRSPAPCLACGHAPASGWSTGPEPDRLGLYVEGVLAKAARGELDA